MRAQNDKFCFSSTDFSGTRNIIENQHEVLGLLLLADGCAKSVHESLDN